MSNKKINGGTTVKYEDESFMTLYFYDGMLRTETGVIERKLEQLGFTDNTVEDEDKK